MLRIMRRTSACITSIVSKAVGVNVEEIGDRDLSGLMALNWLLGIKLMPRMRGLSDTIFYRPNKSIRYQHIDALFGDEIDWDLIATHARDMIQVVLWIQASRCSATTRTRFARQSGGR